MPPRQLVLAALASVIGVSACDPRADLAADVLLSNVNVVDVVADSLVRGQDILVTGSVIGDVIPHGSRRVRAGAVVPGEGSFVIPGLWDMHAHIRSYDPADVLPMFVAYGVTGIRDLGLTSFASIRQARNQIAERSLVGPRVISAGYIVEGREPRFASSLSIASTADIALRLDPVVEEGIEVIKIFQNVPGPLFREIVDYAGERRLRTAGHIPDEWDQVQAAGSGLGSIEHFWGLSQTLSSPDGRLDTAEVDRLAAALLEHGTFQCPTLVNDLLLAEEAFRDHPWLAYSPVYHRVWWDGIWAEEAATFTPAARAAQRSAAALEALAVRELSVRGVKFLAGTDTPNPYLPAGISLHKELELFVEAGMTPGEALRTATLYPAEYFGRTHELGSVAAGRLADLVVLERNPLENIRNTQDIAAVIADGRLFTREALDELERTQLRRFSEYATTDLDQVIYMQVRRAGIDGARERYPHPLRDRGIAAKPEHLLRLSASLERAGERGEARKALEWNLELFPGDRETRLRLDSLWRGEGRPVARTSPQDWR